MLFSRHCRPVSTRANGPTGPASPPPIEPRCRLCIHIPYYPHPSPDPNPIPNPKPDDDRCPITVVYIRSLVITANDLDCCLIDLFSKLATFLKDYAHTLY